MITRKEIKVDDSMFDMLFKKVEEEPNEEEKPDPLAKYGVSNNIEDWDIPF